MKSVFRNALKFILNLIFSTQFVYMHNENDPKGATFYIYNTLNGIQTKIPYKTFNSQRKFASLKIGSGILCIGDGIKRKFTFFINVSNRKYISLKPIINGRYEHSVCGAGQYAYVICGKDNSNFLNSCEKYNLLNNTWEQMLPTNTCKSYVGCCVYNGILYAVGGWNRQGMLHEIESNNLSLPTTPWTMIHKRINLLSSIVLSPLIFPLSKSLILFAVDKHSSFTLDTDNLSTKKYKFSHELNETEKWSMHFTQTEAEKTMNVPIFKCHCRNDDIVWLSTKYQVIKIDTLHNKQSIINYY